MSNSVYFIQHCDDENCSLGTVEYECPQCNKLNVEYDNFYEEYNIGNHNPTYTVKTSCEHCHIELIMYNDNNQTKIK